MRKLLCALAMTVAIFSPSVPVRATVVNIGSLVLNNGIIRVHNNSRESLINIGTIAVFGPGNVMERGTLEPGDTWLTHACCYVAGSRYKLYWGRQDFYFTPHLCFRNGLPYGYADLTIDNYSPVGSPVTTVVLNETHGTCYEGPL